jgi:hypothetical protein
VAAVLTEELPIAPETVFALAAGFAGGMGNMEGTCGAMVGAAMAVGLQMQGSRGAVVKARAIQEDFTRRCGALLCKNLKGVGTGRVLCPCEDCVRNAVRAYESVMGEGGNNQ